MSKLVIVESPAKAKTIQGYLGKDYSVMASMGHVRDLPRSSLGVDVDRDFKPLYLTIDGKEALVKSIKKAAAKSEEVFLATDPDREGEAISWHLAQLLDLDLTGKNRVTFGEITKSGVTEGMGAPRALDMNLINAQQARRILDRIVGYKLSPFLWKKVRRGLSAGRVQSVAVRMVVDREREIEAFVPKEYWQITAMLSAEGNEEAFPSKLRTMKGVKQGDFQIESEARASEIVDALQNETFIVKSVKKSQRKRLPEPPFITSTLQQDAARRLGFSARRTMRAAQQLYEGVEVAGQGTIGLITYMRTDSLRISDDAHAQAVAYIEQTFGERYAEKKARVFRKKRAVAAQDAHEAIRPTSVWITPDMAKATLSQDQYRLYRLIWQRFVASRMANQLQNTTTIDIEAGDYHFRSTGSEILFDGFARLYEVSTDEEKESNPILPPLEQDQKLHTKDILPTQHFTQPPPRFTEASLIRALEENGIGRPSTYAPTISTILDRGYIERQQRALIATELGKVVTDLMKEQFADIVDIRFSAEIEGKLDSVEEGGVEWVSVLEAFYKEFDSSLQQAEKNLDGKKVRVPDEETDIECELCGRQMVIKSGRFGKFLACPGYPECKNTKKISVDTKGVCPQCGTKIVERRSAKGRIYYACDKGKECGFMTWDKPIADRCPQCDSTLFQKKGKSPATVCLKESCGYRKEAH